MVWLVSGSGRFTWVRRIDQLSWGVHERRLHARIVTSVDRFIQFEIYGASAALFFFFILPPLSYFHPLCNGNENENAITCSHPFTKRFASWMIRLPEFLNFFLSFLRVVVDPVKLLPSPPELRSSSTNVNLVKDGKSRETGSSSSLPSIGFFVDGVGTSSHWIGSLLRRELWFQRQVLITCII